MDQKIKDITKKAEDLSKKIGNLQHEKTLPLIELDIILLDIRTLYEEIKSLQTTAATSTLEAAQPEEPITETPETDVTPVEEPVAETPEPEVAPVEEPVAEMPEPEVAPVEEPITETPETEVAPIDEPVAETPEAKVAPPIPKPKPEAKGKSAETTTLGDKYKGGKSYINESLAGNLKKNDISSKIQSKPIQNIASAMGINDRFKLINELFNGDKNSFQNTVSILDGSSNFNEAFNYITSSFDWDMEDDSVQLLLELVRRKFIVNQDE